MSPRLGLPKIAFLAAWMSFVLFGAALPYATRSTRIAVVIFLLVASAPFLIVGLRMSKERFMVANRQKGYMRQFRVVAFISGCLIIASYFVLSLASFRTALLILFIGATLTAIINEQALRACSDSSLRADSLSGDSAG